MTADSRHCLYAALVCLLHNERRSDYDATMACNRIRCGLRDPRLFRVWCAVRARPGSAPGCVRDAGRSPDGAAGRVRRAIDRGIGHMTGAPSVACDASGAPGCTTRREPSGAGTRPEMFRSIDDRIRW